MSGYCSSVKMRYSEIEKLVKESYIEGLVSGYKQANKPNSGAPSQREWELSKARKQLNQLPDCKAI